MRMAQAMVIADLAAAIQEKKPRIKAASDSDVEQIVSQFGYTRAHSLEKGEDLEMYRDPKGDQLSVHDDGTWTHKSGTNLNDIEKGDALDSLYGFLMDFHKPKVVQARNMKAGYEQMDFPRGNVGLDKIGSKKLKITAGGPGSGPQGGKNFFGDDKWDAPIAKHGYSFRKADTSSVDFKNPKGNTLKINDEGDWKHFHYDSGVTSKGSGSKSLGSHLDSVNKIKI